MVNELCLNEALLDGAKEVFETMIFIDIEKSDDSNHAIEGDSLLGSITFTGNLEGCLTICCGTDCAKAIAANMLGMEPDEQVSDEDVCDAIGEVTNMVMGSLKSRIQDNFSKIDVSIPTVVSGQAIENSLGEKATSRVWVNVNVGQDHPALFSLIYKENENA